MPTLWRRAGPRKAPEIGVLGSWLHHAQQSSGWRGSRERRILPRSIHQHSPLGTRAHASSDPPQQARKQWGSVALAFRAQRFTNPPNPPGPGARGACRRAKFPEFVRVVVHLLGHARPPAHSRRGPLKPSCPCPTAQACSLVSTSPSHAPCTSPRYGSPGGGAGLRVMLFTGGAWVLFLCVCARGVRVRVCVCGGGVSGVVCACRVRTCVATHT